MSIVELEQYCRKVCGDILEMGGNKDERLAQANGFISGAYGTWQMMNPDDRDMEFFVSMARIFTEINVGGNGND